MSTDSYQTFTYLRRRTRKSWLTTLFSISMVLFFIGLFFSVLLLVGSLVKDVSQIEMRVFLHDEVGEIQQQEFLSWLDLQEFVRSKEFVSKEQALVIMQEREQENVLELMEGFNPLLAAYHLQLDPAFIQSDSLTNIREKLEAFLIVDAVEYPGERLAKVSQNIQTLTVIFLTLAVVLLVIVFFLILSTIRLSIYAKRLMIRSMQLIGATRNFIRRPFLIGGLTQGLLSGLIASVLLIFSLIGIRNYFSKMGIELNALSNEQLIGLLVGIVLFGILLGLSGSFFAVNKYLDRNLDELM
ncbi:MAG: permease-like cell division protein FtsX [Bacteroidota bacterium]